jgi:hypothetical protein
MKHLELSLRITEYADLDAQTRQMLMEQENVEQMPTERVQQMLRPIAWGDQYVVHAKLNEAGVFITDNWVVLIVGQNYLHCVSSLCSLLKLIEEVLNGHASISLVTVLDKPASPLYSYLARQAKVLTLRKTCQFAGVLILGGIIGAAVSNWIWPLLFGGTSP